MRAAGGGPKALWQITRVLAAGMFVVGCATFGVRTDYDREVRFAAFRTYAWIDSTDIVRERPASPFLERRVRRAVDGALRSRGMVADSGGAPDLLVTALVIGPTPEERAWRYWPSAPCGPVAGISIGIGYPYGYGMRHPRWPWRSPFFRDPWGYACSYRIGFGYLWLPVYGEPGGHLAGTMVIDMLDGRSRELIWRGSAEGAVLGDIEAGATQEELDEVANRILREFPPGVRR